MKSEIQINNTAGVCQIDIEGTIGVPEEWQFEEPDARVATYERFRDALRRIAEIEGTRFTPCVIAAFFLMTTTSVSEFIGSMKKMHITDKITIPLSVVFRFFPTVKEDAGAINDAMKMRGITPKNPMLMLEYRVVPLIISTVKAGEDLSCSALTRGLGSPKKRTNMCDIGFHLWDWLIFGICVCCILVFCFQNQICSLLNL